MIFQRDAFAQISQIRKRHDLPHVGKNGSKNCAPHQADVEKCLKVSSTRSVESRRNPRQIRTSCFHIHESMFDLEK